MKNGFSLVETLVALALFVLISSVVYSVYIFNQRAYVAGEASAEITQNGRVIIERMTREIRQAKKVIVSLEPTKTTDSTTTFTFEDGHLPAITEQNNAQGGATAEIILSSVSSSVDDYYKDMFVRIISGIGQNQIRKIYSYDGITKTATVNSAWDTIPQSSSVYRIDNNYNYISFYMNGNNVFREIFAYCVSSDGGVTCSPEDFFDWPSGAPVGKTGKRISLEAAKDIGEFVSDLRFWGDESSKVSIFLELQKNGKKVDLQSEVAGRNL